jgi:RNA polymerase sigma factor (sigma-70 family)
VAGAVGSASDRVDRVGRRLGAGGIAGFLKRRDVAAPTAYLRRSVVNGAINAGRRASRERRHLPAAYELQSVSAPEVDELWPLVLALPARQRAVLVLRYYDHLNEAEIARVLDCPPGTVKSLAARALAALRKEMSS